MYVVKNVTPIRRKLRHVCMTSHGIGGTKRRMHMTKLQMMPATTIQKITQAQNIQYTHPKRGVTKHNALSQPAARYLTLFYNSRGSIWSTLKRSLHHVICMTVPTNGPFSCLKNASILKPKVKKSPHLQNGTSNTLHNLGDTTKSNQWTLVMNGHGGDTKQHTNICLTFLNIAPF